jgi:hypothetical protein
MYRFLVYPITEYVWRWEIRRLGVLLRCGTARTKAEAQNAIHEVVNA